MSNEERYRYKVTWRMDRIFGSEEARKAMDNERTRERDKLRRAGKRSGKVRQDAKQNMGSVVSAKKLQPV
jgi:hypothetical protein